MTTIRVADYYGNPMSYRFMPENVFDRLEQAFLDNVTTIEVTEEEYALLRRGTDCTAD